MPRFRLANTNILFEAWPHVWYGKPVALEDAWIAQADRAGALYAPSELEPLDEEAQALKTACLLARSS